MGKIVELNGYLWEVTKTGPNTHWQMIDKIKVEEVPEPSEPISEQKVEDRPQEENNELIAAEIKPKRKKKK